MSVVATKRSSPGRWIAPVAVGAGAVVAGLAVRTARRRAGPPDAPADVSFMRALHAALRRDLSRLQAVAGSLPASGPAPAEVLTGWNGFRRQLENHHSAEDDDLWPVLRQRLSDPADLALLDEMVAEHAQIPAALADVDSALRTGRDLAAATERLSGIVLTHLEHEERQVLPLVERHLTRAEWRSFLLTERSRTPLRDRPEFLTWILDDADQRDAAAVLVEMPPPARLVYRRILRPRYETENRWQLPTR
ncbi:MAG TPA: hemerythrin domain-containing protein [Mycobacteriales bacterium]